MNSLYFWGGGILPDQVKFHAGKVISNDVAIQSLMLHAGLSHAENAGAVLNDCRHMRDWAIFEQDQLLPAFTRLKNKEYSSIVLDFADGASFEIRASQKWRFWCGPLNLWRELA